MCAFARWRTAATTWAEIDRDVVSRLDAIRQSIIDRGYPPTLREIGAHMGIKSTNGVNDHLRALERKGYLRHREDGNRHIYSAIEAMKEEAILVNTGRGATVDQKALGEALAEGRIFGAGLDCGAPNRMIAWDELRPNRLDEPVLHDAAPGGLPVAAPEGVDQESQLGGVVDGVAEAHLRGQHLARLPRQDLDVRRHDGQRKRRRQRDAPVARGVGRRDEDEAAEEGRQYVVAVQAARCFAFARQHGVDEVRLVERAAEERVDRPRPRHAAIERSMPSRLRAARRAHPARSRATPRQGLRGPRRTWSRPTTRSWRRRSRTPDRQGNCPGSVAAGPGRSLGVPTRPG